MWDTTARQFKLDAVDIPEFAKSASTINAGVLRSSKRPTDAIRLARFLAAPDKGQTVMAKHHYAPLPGDPWAVEPRITLFAGGLNGVGVRQTIDDFRNREGVKVLEEYQGCGTLVGMMKAGQHPDAYFACDVSFTRQVADLFHDFQNVTQARMVILVPKGNPKNIATLEDLGKEGVAVGVADEEKSALGALTMNLLKAQGIYDAVRKNVKATAPTADFLVAQLVESGRLHAAVVYDANCTYVLDKATMIPIPHPAAIAIQPLGVSKETKYPQLVARLRDAITTAQSKERFEKAGFQWVWAGQ
jgi:ABC-type molybdate transport system substrate-binding protein